MQSLIHELTLVTIFAPLLGGIIAGLFGKQIGRRGASWITILLMLAAFLSALYMFKLIVLDGDNSTSFILYRWATSGSFSFNVSFLVDHLTACMMVIVTFVSLLVHIYSIGYMKDDPGFQRFFSYMSLFTFFMLALVGANNFFLLFFGWEGVGLVSYLLIGFWFKKESAAEGSLKAFLVNRVGDFGFILGIAAILDYFGTVNYQQVFAKAPELAHTTISLFPGSHWSIITVICILLFIGAMGKSAQMPLHVWLPESMEGPTPISALIHAATMVTAGVYMVARMSPLFELSTVSLSVVLVVGASGALFMGILGLVTFDIKRVVAYSTMSQLGYMMAGNGASAYAAGIFHLFTHANFKALLFLAAGSVIIAMHHEQDMRKMGGLRKYMPITYIAFLFGGLALAAIPPFSGYYSKDAIIDAVHLSTIPGATYAYWALLLGAFVTGLYTFRAFFMTFHTKEKIPADIKKHVKESPAVVTIPLIILSITSLVIGFIAAGPILYQTKGLLGNAIFVLPQHNVLATMAQHWQGPYQAIINSFSTYPFWFAVSGIIVAWLCYVKFPSLPAILAKRFNLLYQIMLHKYGFDAFNDLVFVRGTRRMSNFFFKVADVKVIDDWIVNGSGRGVARLSRVLRRMQTGYLYHYAFAMIIGLLGFSIWLIWA